MPTVNVLNKPVYILGVLHEHKSVAFGETGFVSSDDDILYASWCMGSDKVFKLLDGRVVRHVHQVDSFLNQSTVTPFWLETTFLEERCDLADQVVNRAVVELTDALLCGLLV